MKEFVPVKFSHIKAKMNMHRIGRRINQFEKAGWEIKFVEKGLENEVLVTPRGYVYRFEGMAATDDSEIEFEFRDPIDQIEEIDANNLFRLLHDRSSLKLYLKFFK